MGFIAFKKCFKSLSLIILYIPLQYIRLFRIVSDVQRNFYNDTKVLHRECPTIIQMLLQLVLIMEGVKYRVNFGKDHLDN